MLLQYSTKQGHFQQDWGDCVQASDRLSLKYNWISSRDAQSVNWSERCVCSDRLALSAILDKGEAFVL
jgi:hypothetical protein